MNTLTANIQREWLARIIDHSKTTEYRDATDFWFNRLERVGPPPFYLRLINGMRPDSPEATVLVDKVENDLLKGVLKFHIAEVVSTSRWDAKWNKQYPPLPTDPAFDPVTLLKQKLPLTKVMVKVERTLLTALQAPGVHQFTLRFDLKLAQRLSNRGPDPVRLNLSTSAASVEVVAYDIGYQYFGGDLNFSVLTPPPSTSDKAANIEGVAVNQTLEKAQSQREPPVEPNPPANRTIREMQARPFSAGNEDILTGLQFCATMQLRTPLRVLRRHGEIHTDRTIAPPAIALDSGDGCWLPITKSWRELGIDLPEMPPTTMASDVGQIPVSGGEYLHFLVAVRTIVEGTQAILERRAGLDLELDNPRWANLVIKLGGKAAIVNRFFKPFLTTVRGLTSLVTEEMRRRNLITPERIALVSNAELLRIKGMGPAKLKELRARCALAESKDEWVDVVNR